MQEKIDALNQANPRTSYHKVGEIRHTKRYVLKTDMPEAIRILRLPYPDDIPEEAIIAAGQLSYIDPNEYGPRYGGNDSNYTFEFNLDGLNPVLAGKTANLTQTNQASANGITFSGQRDVFLKFTGSFTPSGNRGFRVKINGTTRFTTSNHYQSGIERNFTFNIHRKDLSAGNNTIVIEPTNSSYTWGLKDISAKFAPVVPLTLGQTDSTEYGYDGTPQRFTGVRTSFDLTSTDNDVLLSMAGWDIDTVDETSVFINGSSLGNLTQATGSSEYSPKDYFLLTKGLLHEGLNYIELVQRETDASWTGYQDEKWAVKDLRIQIANPDLTVSDVSLVDISLEVNVPFSISTTVRNIGTGSSSDSTVTFHISADQNIATSDPQVKLLPVGALLPNSNANLNTTIQTPLVNQGYYLGVCVNTVVGETSSTNNCSEGVPLKGNVTIAPIIMLLL